MRVFIGSTFEDLQEHRKATIEALTELSVQIEAMELWYARPEDPLSVCLQHVDDSDVYVCILAHRYGSTRLLKSFTHREYERAERAGKDRLIFIMSSEYPIRGRLVDRGISAWRLDRFKKNLKARHFVLDFSSPSDLAHKVVESVRDLMVRRRDEQARSLDLGEFWRSLESQWKRIAPPELRIPFQANDDLLILMDKVEVELQGVATFHQFIEQSHERLGDDLRDVITRIGGNPTKLEQIPYHENPFAYRDAELLMLFPNRIYRLEALVAQARVAILENRLAGERDVAEELARAKRGLSKALSRIQID